MLMLDLLASKMERSKHTIFVNSCKRRIILERKDSLFKEKKTTKDKSGLKFSILWYKYNIEDGTNSRIPIIDGQKEVE